MKRALCVLALLATACPPNSPSNPTPSPSGGAGPLGGSGGLGGCTTAAAGGSGGQTAPATDRGTGGETAPNPTKPVIFPACNPPTHKAPPIDRSKYKLGRRRSAMVRARKASYATDPSARRVFYGPLIASAPDQRDLGACTGYAALQCRLAEPFALVTLPAPFGPLSTLADFEQLARDIYSGATRRDPWPGAWPPDDTGSNGESALNEAISRGLFKSFTSVSTLAGLQRALQRGPCIAGVDWHEGMFAPTNCGQISPTGPVVGGHEFAVVGDDTEKKQIWGLNSWGDGFGVRVGLHGGYFNLTYGAVSQLLAAGGEIECPQ